MNSIGRLFGIGLGPGDPELLTLKALNALRRAAVVAVPLSRQGETSYALQIAAPHLRPEQQVRPLLFPMVHDLAARQRSRQAAADVVTAELRAGRDVAFLTEGDPLLHSTFIYLLRCLPEDLPIEIIPGVTSVSAAAAQASYPLVNANQRLAILPAVFLRPDELRRLLSEFDTVVLLKVHSVLEQALDVLEELGLCDGAVLVERASHPGARVVRDVRSLRGAPVNYLSLLIVPGLRRAAG